MSTQTITTITFEDHGQDFLKWEINSQGEVIDSTPFQAWLWCQSTVMNHRQLKVGGYVYYMRRKQIDTEVRSIKYPILAITTREVPCE